MHLKNQKLLSSLTSYAGIGSVLVGIIIYFSIKSPNFLTVTNFIGIANQLPSAILVAVGMTYVLIVAGIDLSVGSIVGLSSAVFALALEQHGLPIPVAILASVVVGLLCGLVNGLVTVRWNLPPFIVTLGMLEIARGATFYITDTRTIYLGSKISSLSSAGIGKLSYLFIISIGVVIISQFVLTKTVFGRYMVAIGTNEEAVRLSGIKVWPTKLAVYALSGLLCAVAGLADIARMASANPNSGTGFELEAIAAAVIGGTSLMGGRGSTITTLIGVVIMALLSSGLSQIGAEEPTKRIITGLAISLAVIMDYYRTKLPLARKK